MRGIDWNSVRCFVAVAQAGSLTRAASDLSLSVGAISRRIDDLEDRLSLKLLRRGPQGVALTPAGEQVRRAAQAGADHLLGLEQLASALRDPSNKPPIRISATEPLIAQVLAPRVADLAARDPSLRVTLSASNENVSLQAGDADIAIRMAKPESATIIGRRLAPISLGLYCSRGYLDGRDPAALDLAKETLLWFDDAYGDIPENRWIGERSLDSNVALRSTSSEALRQAALAGSGIAPLARALATHDELVEIVADALPERQPWLLFHRDQRNAADHKTARNWIVTSCNSFFR